MKPTNSDSEFFDSLQSTDDVLPVIPGFHGGKRRKKPARYTAEYQLFPTEHNKYLRRFNIPGKWRKVGRYSTLKGAIQAVSRELRANNWLIEETTFQFRITGPSGVERAIYGKDSQGAFNIHKVFVATHE